MEYIPLILKNGFSVLIGGEETVWLAIRVALGTFFAISGMHKLFWSERHASLVETLRDAKIPYLKFNQWFVPGVEFTAGIAVIIGLATPVFASLLGAICLVACFTTAIPSIRTSYNPIDKADWLDDLLYIPETLYLGFILLLVVMGGGQYSLDAYLLG